MPDTNNCDCGVGLLRASTSKCDTTILSVVYSLTYEGSWVRTPTPQSQMHPNRVIALPMTYA